MIIEFIAVPGSGKTFFSDKLYDLLKRELSNKNIKLYTRVDIDNIKTNNRFEFYILFKLIKVIDANILYFMFKNMFNKEHNFKTNFHLNLYLLDVFLNYKTIYNLEKKHEGRCIFVLDEGVLHASTVYVKNLKNKYFTNYFKMVKNRSWGKTKQLSIFIDCNREVLCRRLNERKEGWPIIWKNLAEKEKQSKVKKSFLKFSAKKKYFLKNKNEMSYHIIDNNECLINNSLQYDDILNKINKLAENIFEIKS